MSLNTEKTRIVTITDDARRLRVPGLRVSVGTEQEDRAMVPVHDSATEEGHRCPAEGQGHASRGRHLPMQAAVAQVNLILRGWVNYFRVGNSSQAFNKVQYHVERKVRRFAAKQEQAHGIRLEAVE